MNNSLKQITIIIALKNCSEDLKSTLKSICSQSECSFVHVIIMDSLSNDEPLLVVNQFNKTISIEYYSEQDSGIYEAWNKALIKCRTKWLTFFGAGDILCEGALSHLISLCSIYSQFDIISSRSKIIYPNNSERISGKPFVKKEFINYFSINHPGLLYKKTVFERFGNYSLKFRFCSDYEFLYRNFEKLSFAFSPFVVSIYPYGGLSASSWRPIYETFLIKNEYKKTNILFSIWYLFYGIISNIYRKWKD